MNIPVAVRFYVVSLVMFVLVSWAIVDVRGRAEARWWAAGDTGIASAQEPLVQLLAAAHADPWTADRLATWHAAIHPNQAFALYDATGRRLLGHRDADLPAPRHDPSGPTVQPDPASGAEHIRFTAASGAVYDGVARYDPSPAQRAIEDEAWWASAAVMSLGWLVVAAGFGWTVARPLRRLTRAAQRLADGDLTARAGVQQADEIGDLARAFDAMAERIARLIGAQQVLMAQVSHELRTPLARLRVALDLSDEADPADLRRLLGGMGEDLQELEQLVSDVLAFSRLEVAAAGGAPPPRLAPLDLAALLQGVGARFRAAYPDRALTVDTPAHAVEVDGDATLLARALLNLLDNAHKHSPAGAPIAVALDPERAQITVRDHGPGIDPTDLPRVFEPFFRGRQAETGASSGFGLGLSLCRRAVEVHHGAIDLRNHPDGGVLAEVTLQRRAAG
jgi:signal transduction histidine kinase